MAESVEDRIVRASRATEEEIAAFVYDPSPAVVKALLANRNITEQAVSIIAGRKNLPGDVLEMIARDRRWSESYPIKLALAKNPRTPLFAALSIARHLRLFDLAEICSSHSLPVVYRKKVEAVIIEKIPTMPLGMKRSLAKTAAGDVLFAMLQDPDPDVVQLCLNNPRMVEAHVFRLITRKDTSPLSIRMIADHPKWSSRYTVRLTLIRSDHTPLARSVRFFQEIRTRDLRELYFDASVPVTVKPYIYNELKERGLDSLDIYEPEEKIYTIEEEDTGEWPPKSEEE